MIGSSNMSSLFKVKCNNVEKEYLPWSLDSAMFLYQKFKIDVSHEIIDLNGNDMKMKMKNIKHKIHTFCVN